MTLDQLEKLLVTALRNSMAGRSTVVPEPGGLVWKWFIELSSTRTYHPAGPNAVSFAEIEAWARLSGWALQAHHIRLLRALDAAWLDVAYASRGDGKTKPKKPSGALSADAFDAVFG